MKFPLDIKIASYLDVKVPFTKLKRRRWWIDSKKKEMESTETIENQEQLKEEEK